MLKALDIQKAFDGAPLFSGISLVLQDGDRVGLVGPNGTGKTTLLRILAGAERPDRGSVSLGAGERVGYLAQQAPRARRHPRPLPGRVARARSTSCTSRSSSSSGGWRPATPRPRRCGRYGEVQERYAPARRLDVRSIAAGGQGAARDRAPRRGRAAARPVGRRAGPGAARRRAARPAERAAARRADEPPRPRGARLARVVPRQEFAGAVLVVSHDRRFLDRGGDPDGRARRGARRAADLRRRLHRVPRARRRAASSACRRSSRPRRSTAAGSSRTSPRPAARRSTPSAP